MKKAPELIHLIAMKLPSGNNLQSILTASKMQTVQATRPAVVPGRNCQGSAFLPTAYN